MPQWMLTGLTRVTVFLSTGNRLFVIATFLTAVLIVLYFDLRRGRSLRRYLSRATLTDVLYNAFYTSGIYSLFIWGPLYGALQKGVHAHARFLEMNLLNGMPAWLHYGIFILVTDFIAYWQHRWMHSNRFLWTLHGIHHSQTNLSILTARRFHFADSIIDNLIWFVPAIILGVPIHVSVAILMLQQLYSTMQHSDTDWSWGPVETLFVSPRYHSVHHSIEPADYDKNFGALFAVWDHFFGTAVHPESRQMTYGAPGLGVPEGFFAQLVFPARAVMRELRARREARMAEPLAPAAPAP